MPVEVCFVSIEAHEDDLDVFLVATSCVRELVPRLKIVVKLSAGGSPVCADVNCKVVSSVFAGWFDAFLALQFVSDDSFHIFILKL